MNSQQFLEFMEEIGVGGRPAPIFVEPSPEDEVLMPALLAQGLSLVREDGLQYNSRSDRHEKLAMVGLCLDLIRLSPRFRARLSAGELVCGFQSHHHSMLGPNGRPGEMDFVAGTPGTWGLTRAPRTLSQVMCEAGLSNSPYTLIADSSPGIREGHVLKPLVMAEGKGAFLDLGGQVSRVQQDLSGKVALSRDHGSLLTGIVVLNVAESCISSQNNPERKVSRNDPKGLENLISAITNVVDCEVALVFVHCQNDGSPVRIVRHLPEEDPRNYSHLVRKWAAEIERRLA